MHMAAVSNNTFVITYLHQNSSLEIDCEDIVGNTALHYACDSGAEMAAQWLIGFGHPINCKNNQEQTPLHTLMSADENLISTRFTKELIFRGASREAEDKKG
jgi:ankyrin repeat protein